MQSQTRTFQTRLTGGQTVLAALAALYSTVARRVDAGLARGENPRDIAKTYWQPHGILSKNLDHILRQVQGKRKAVVELALVQAVDFKTRIKAKERQIALKRERQIQLPSEIEAWQVKLADPAIVGEERRDCARSLRGATRTLNTLPKSLFQHTRRLSRLRDLLAAAEERAKHPTICHGSRALFLKQYRLAENGYTDHAAWLADWQAARSSQFMVEGAAACPTGNQFVRCTVRPDGRFDLEIRLPPALHHLATRVWTIRDGTEIFAFDLRGLAFPHGGSEIRAALASRHPISWRFVRDATSWRVMAIVGTEVEVEIGADWSRGALGVDLNADHVALCHVSPDGNPRQVWRIPLVTYGLFEGQRLDLVRKVADRIRAIAGELGVAVVSEKLDFGKKRAQLTSDHSAGYARTLTSFAYRSFHVALRSALVRDGIRHVTVNAAYTSLIGRVKFARQYGLSVHAAASLSIARRAMGHSERLPNTVHAETKEATAVASLDVPLDGGGHVTLPAPVRMRSGPRGARRHVWSCWGRAFGRWKAAHEAHARSRRKARSAAASGGPEKPEPAAAGTGASVPIVWGRRRPSRRDVEAKACPGAGGGAQALTPRRVSTRKSG